MDQMSYAIAKLLLDAGKAAIVKIQPEDYGFGWFAVIRVDGKHDYQLTLSAAQKLTLTKKEANGGRP